MLVRHGSSPTDTGYELPTQISVFHAPRAKITRTVGAIAGVPEAASIPAGIAHLVSSNHAASLSAAGYNRQVTGGETADHVTRISITQAQATGCVCTGFY